jgi:hypothetical protein
MVVCMPPYLCTLCHALFCCVARVDGALSAHHDLFTVCLSPASLPSLSSPRQPLQPAGPCPPPCSLGSYPITTTVESTPHSHSSTLCRAAQAHLDGHALLSVRKPWTLWRNGGFNSIARGLIPILDRPRAHFVPSPCAAMSNLQARSLGLAEVSKAIKEWERRQADPTTSSHRVSTAFSSAQPGAT